jgi:hypothetical protein
LAGVRHGMDVVAVTRALKTVEQDNQWRLFTRVFWQWRHNEMIDIDEVAIRRLPPFAVPLRNRIHQIRRNGWNAPTSDHTPFGTGARTT